jgi:hypothetical protein
MNPRLSTLKTWTSLPREFREKAAQVFAQNFRKESVKGDFVIDGRIYPTEIILRAGYTEKGRLKQTNFEVSIDLNLGMAADQGTDKSSMDQLFLGIDVLGSVFETHFEHLSEEESDDVEYPYTWEEFEFDDHKVHLRFSTVNTRLEDEADRILGQGAPGLFNEDHEASTDAMTRAEIDSDLAKDVSQAIRDGRYKPKMDVDAPQQDSDVH